MCKEEVNTTSKKLGTKLNLPSKGFITDHKVKKDSRANHADGGTVASGRASFVVSYADMHN